MKVALYRRKEKVYARNIFIRSSDSERNKPLRYYSSTLPRWLFNLRRTKFKQTNKTIDGDDDVDEDDVALNN